MKNDVSKRKKTSKEKRALIGALCIAAAVAAGSTFAWFSSVDEVTNRLSANAAYDVSIIETFTPPTNWIPGQKVNKDTAAVNTGNIPAFVKQKLEGKMRVTMEEAVDTFAPSDTKKYIELTEDELDSIEAGGFLAWASNGRDEANRIGIEKGKGVADPNQCYLGEVSAVHSGANFEDMKPGSDYYSKIQFAPPATGDYIFRRVIDVAGDGTETYEYAGYHYDATKGKYYKIKVINELQPGEDGILKEAPKVYYGVEKEDIQILPLRYEEAGTEKYFKYIPDSTGEQTKVEYTEVTSQTINSNSAEFEVYAFGSTSYCVVIDKGSSDLNVGDVYTSAVPLGTKIGHIVGSVSEKKYVEDKSTPQRLVATYPVGKSDDVFIGESTEMSDPTADSYDTHLRDIAYSDYIKAKVEFENKKAEYELNKAAYDAAVALLTALKSNEEKLNNMNAAFVGLGTFNGEINQPDFHCSDGSANATIKDKADEMFTNQISQMNTAFGSYEDVGDPAKKQNQYVHLFLDAVNVYKGEPTDENWRNVSNTYQEVTRHFTNVNSKVSAFEAAIVEKWETAGVNGDIIRRVDDIANYTLTGNISDDAITVKYAAEKLVAWEKQLAAYQKEVNNYFKKISDIQSNSEYTLQDLRPLNAAYTKAVGDHAVKSKTNAAESGLASEVLPDGEFEVSPDYYITANSNPRNALELNDSKEPPIKNTISNNGYAGTAAIPYITGSQPFKIGNKAIAEVTPPDYNTVTDLEGKYIAAQDEYNKYKTKHTNQETNNDIVIYINLKNVSAGGTVNKNEWKLSPTLVAGDKEANFYYTSILGAGEQTSILVDSLELSGDTTNVAFKDFDFDLNVTVDSSQVVVSEDGNYYESTAVMANDAFKVKPSKVKYEKEEAKPVNLDEKCKVDWT